MFEILEHTADIGLRAWGATLQEAFENAATALSAIVVELDDIDPRIAYPIAASGDDDQSLLVNWLDEALYYLDARRIVLRRFRIEHFGDGRVAGQAWGEPRDPLKHRPKVIVKGVTYHQLKIEQRPDGWQVQVFLDI
ncbi:MAG: archease [Bryobacterales bacterium]|nr:archease [Bryobacterales bacterium]